MPESFRSFSDSGQEKLLKNVKAGSHKNLILEDIRKVSIPIPSKKELKAIVKALLDVDELIRTLTTLIAKKEDNKQIITDNNIIFFILVLDIQILSTFSMSLNEAFSGGDIAAH